MAAHQFAKLSSGFTIPMVGLGTFRAVEAEVIKCAVKSGYRHLDTANLYANEAIIGSALKELFEEKVVKREELFITTKLAPTHHQRHLVMECLKKQLESLQVSYVDLYLIHNPMAMKYTGKPGFPTDEQGNLLFDCDVKLEDTWLGLEDCVKAGLVKSIGVSNFNESQLQRIFKVCTIKPAVHQIESNPYFQNTSLINFCQANGLIVTAYGPLGAAIEKFKNLLQDEVLVKIAKKYGKNSAQVALRWQVQRSVVVIPKSGNPTRLAENLNIWDFELSTEDLAEIAKLDTGVRAYHGLEYGPFNKHPEFPFTEFK